VGGEERICRVNDDPIGSHLKFTWPAGAEDIAAAVAWVRTGSESAAQSRAHLPDGTFGWRGSRRRLCVAPGILQGEGRGVAGAIMLSGIYDLTATPLPIPNAAYFGANAYATTNNPRCRVC